MGLRGIEASCNNVKRPSSIASRKTNTTDQNQYGFPRPRPIVTRKGSPGSQNKDADPIHKIERKINTAPPTFGPFYKGRNRRDEEASTRKSSEYCPKRTQRSRKILPKSSSQRSSVGRVLNLKGSDRSRPSVTITEKDFSSGSNLPSSPSIASDTCSEILEIEKTGYGISLLNLDNEDFQWFSDIELEKNDVQSCFSTSSSRSCLDSELSPLSVSSCIEMGSKKSQYDLCSEDISDYTDLEGFSNDDPIFWPLQQNFDKTVDYFDISPRKNILVSPFENRNEIEIPDEASSKCSVHQETSFALDSRSSVLKILELEQIVERNRIEVINDKPSGLSDSHEASREEIYQEPLQKKLESYKMFLEEFFRPDEKLSIESRVGLSEFDGHEGIDSQFNPDVFLID